MPPFNLAETIVHAENLFRMCKTAFCLDASILSAEEVFQ